MKKDRLPSVQQPDALVPEHEEKKCLNCGAMVEGVAFCPVCGQRTSLGRIDRKALGRSLVYSFFNADRGIWFTIKALFTFPGRFIYSYIRGARVRSFPPFSLLFVVSAFYALIDNISKGVHKKADTALAAEITGLSVDELETKTFDWMGTIMDTHPMLNVFLEWVSGNYGLIILLALPLLVLAIRASMGKRFRKTYNGSETFVIGAYMVGQYYLVMGVMALITLLFPAFEDTQAFFAVLLIPAFISWDMGVLTGLGYNKLISKSIGAIFLFFFLVLLLVLVLFIPAGFLINKMAPWEELTSNLFLG